MADGNAVAVQEAPQVPTVTSEAGALISMIERAARDPAVDIAKMERLFEMQERASARHAKELYLCALSAMQAELPAVARLGKGHNEKKYARFEDIIEAIKPVLAQHGFSLTFRVKQEDKTMTVVGVLGHSGGHAEETAMTLPADMTGNKSPVQAWGSTASYGKRYVTLTITGIATEDEDDDGAGALRGKRKSSAESKRDGTSVRFNEIKKMFEQAPDIPTLREISREVQDEINSMPERWATILSDTWDLRRDELSAKS